MKGEEFVKGMKVLQSSYQKDFTQDDLKIWYIQFKSRNKETFYKAINTLIRTNKYMPSIAEILDEMAKIENETLTIDIDEEFDNVRKAIRRYGSYRIPELMNSLNETTVNIVRMIGINKICNATEEDITWIKKDFKELYENQQISEKQDYLLNNAIKSEIKRIGGSDE